MGHNLEKLTRDEINACAAYKADLISELSELAGNFYDEIRLSDACVPTSAELDLSDRSVESEHFARALVYLLLEKNGYLKLLEESEPVLDSSILGTIEAIAM